MHMVAACSTMATFLVPKWARWPVPRGAKRKITGLSTCKTSSRSLIITLCCTGKVDILVCGVGTGGTITGCGEVLKSRKPGVQVVAVEPVNSPVITQLRGNQPLKPGPHKIQGIGAGFIPDNLNPEVIDDVVLVKDEECVRDDPPARPRGGDALRDLLRRRGGRRRSRSHSRPENAGKLIVVVLPDLGERYLSTPLFPE